MPKDNLIDLHCHILPKIDDGSKTLDDSIKLAEAAIRDGVKYIVATPHHLDRQYTNHAKNVQTAVDIFQDELDQMGLDLIIYPSQEIHLNGDLDKKIDDLLGLDEHRKYMLIEFPHEQVPSYAKELLFNLSLQGVTPVIAHPERNKQIQDDPNILYDFVADGALSQVTATSLTGGFGKDTQKFAQMLITHGLVHVVASDAHALKGRKFVLREAYAELDQFLSGLGDIFYDNSKAIINGDDLKQHFEIIPF